MAMRIEGRLHRRHQCLAVHPSWKAEESSPVYPTDSSKVSPIVPKPMQVGHRRLTPQQKQQRLALGLCLYCGKPGHFAAGCPLKAKASQ